MKKRIGIILSLILSLGICTSFGTTTITKEFSTDGTPRVVHSTTVVQAYSAELPASASPMDGRPFSDTSFAFRADATSDYYLADYEVDGTENAVAHFDTEDVITLYAQDGRTINISPSQREAYNAVGWYDEPFITVYAQDGRTFNIQPAELELYHDLGWYDEPFITVYAQDGRTFNIQPAELELYHDLGWYDEPFITLYAQDGRTLSVQVSQQEAYNAVGWYNEPFITLYAQDGRTLSVQVSQHEIYNELGWYDEPFVTMYAQDGRTLNVQPSQVDAYLQVGWYKSPSDFPVPAGGKMVALTFDDGPSKNTERILDCLAKYNAKATFFVIGTSAKSYPNIVKRAYNMGMEIGNHTMNHPKLTSLGASGIQSQFSACASAISAATGAKHTLIRPPYGSYNSTVSSVADAPLILWSIDTLDWKHRNPDKTVQSVLSNVKDGSIVLMHDLYSQTADAAVRLIPELVSRGYKLVTVSELARAKGYNLQNGKAYSSFK